MGVNIDLQNKLVDGVVNRIKTIVQTRKDKPALNIHHPSMVIDYKALIKEAGYSPSVQEQRTRVMSSKGFQMRLQAKISTDEIINIQQSNLHAKTLTTVKVPNSFLVEDAEKLAKGLNGDFITFSPPTRFGRVAYFTIPLHKIRDASLDKLYKLAGVYAAEKVDVTTRPLEGISDEDLAIKVAEAKKRFEK